MAVPQAIFDPSPAAPWWRLPWPNDATWHSGIAGLSRHPLAARFRPVAEAHGPSPTGSAYAAFDSPVPDLRATILDLESGEELPADSHWFGEQSMHHPANLSAVMPRPGWVMRAGVPHAILWHSATARRSPLLDRALAGDGDARLAAAYRPLARRAPLPGDLATATVFTPADQTAPLRQLVEAALPHSSGLAPRQLRCRAGTAGSDVHEGVWDAPQFRTGRGMRLVAGGASQLTPNGTEPVPFALVLPPGPPPPDGWPLVLSLHGGGCTYLERLTEISSVAVPLGLAVCQQTLPYNRGRPLGTRTYGDMAYFNVFNPAGSVGLFHQAVVEQMLFLRMLLATWPLDASRLSCIGHSNGGTTAAMLLAVEPLLRAGVVAGFGGHVATYVEESDVIGEVMDRLWPTMTGRSLRSEPRSRFHPFVNLAHTAWGVWDTLNFSPHWLQRPLPGVGPTDVFLTQGMHDPYASVRGTTAVIAAAGLDVAGDPCLLPEAAYAHDVLEARGLEPLPYPVAGNVSCPDGSQHTGVAREVAAVASGHEVCFEDASVLAQWVRAFASLAHEGEMRVDAPPLPCREAHSAGRLRR